jgi:hypothetical protein
MGKVARSLMYFVLCGAISAGMAYPGRAAAASAATLSQVILPLQCNVDIVAVGSAKIVRLVPAECARLPEARQLLVRTIHSLH